MERKWQELPTMGEGFAYPKDLFYYNKISAGDTALFVFLD
jgi:hypothetical protein